MLIQSVAQPEYYPPVEATIENNLKNIANRIEESSCQRLLSVAEENLRNWTHVLENKKILPTRLSPTGLSSNAACFFSSWHKSDSLEYYGAENGIMGFPSHLEKELALLKTALHAFKAEGGLPDSHACDLLMMRMASLSRFISYWTSTISALFPRTVDKISVAVQRQPISYQQMLGNNACASLVDQVASPSTSKQEKQLDPENISETKLCRFIWEQYLLWEPWLNQGIIAWRQNTLRDFLASAQKINQLVHSSDDSLQNYLPQFGWPFRRKGQSRFLVEEEVIRYSRDCRMRSGFRIAMLNLKVALKNCQVQDHLENIYQESIHFEYMISQNYFVTACRPFMRVSKSYGHALIRKTSSLHHYLIAPNEFYKQAMLCYTNAYQPESGMHNETYLQMQRLWRTLACHPTVEAPQKIAPLLEKALLAWDGNHRLAFNKQLFFFAQEFVAWCNGLGSAPWQTALTGLRAHSYLEQSRY